MTNQQFNTKYNLTGETIWRKFKNGDLRWLRKQDIEVLTRNGLIGHLRLLTDLGRQAMNDAQGIDTITPDSNIRLATDDIAQKSKSDPIVAFQYDQMGIMSAIVHKSGKVCRLLGIKDAVEAVENRKQILLEEVGRLDLILEKLRSDDQ